MQKKLKKNLNKTKIISFTLIVCVILFPFNINYLLNGLPLNGFWEIVFILFVFPITIYFDKKILINKRFLIFLILFTLVKISSTIIYEKNSLYANVKIIDENIKFDQNIFLKNPETLWHNHTTEITKNLLKNDEFYKSWGSRLDSERKKNIEIQLNLVGKIILKSNEKLNIETSGKFIHDSKYLKISPKKNLYQIYNDNDRLQLYDLSNIHLKFNRGDQWYLKLVISKEDKRINPFNYKRFNQFDFNTKNLIFIDYLVFLILIFEICFIITFIYSLFKSLLDYKINILSNFNTFFLVVNLFGTSIFYLLIKHNFIYDPTYLSPIGFYISFQFLMYLIFKYFRPNAVIIEPIKKNKTIYLYIFLPIIFYFVFILYNHISIFNYFPLVPGNADDWSFDLWLARYILLENDTSITKPCLRIAINQLDSFQISKNLFYKDVKEICSSIESSYSIYQNQFFYRYYSSFIFLIFGFNYFVFIVLNFYLIFMIILITRKLFLKTLSINMFYLFVTIYLSCLTVGSFRYNILKPSSELLATGLIFVTMFFLNKHNQTKYLKYFIFACVIALIASLTRVNLLFVIGSLIILIISKDEIKNILTFKIKSLKNLFCDKFYKTITYLLFTGISILIIAFRNYIFADNFVLPNPSSEASIIEHINYLPYWFYEIFAATAWPQKPNFTSVILILGCILPYYLTIKSKEFFYENYIFLIILSITLLSYFLYLGAAYPPRFSIHLLPLSTLGVILFLKQINLKIKKY